MLTVRNLQKSFGKNTALGGVSFVLEGGTCGILGPNGAGKTTLLRLITGLMNADSGEIRGPQKIGYLPQRFGAYKTLTVQEILEYYAALKKVPTDNLKKAAEAAAETVNLTEQLKTKAGELSGGMLRRLGIAQAVLGEPDLILFDEPTAGLDPEERMRFKLLLSELRRKGVCAVISTHIVEDVEAVCDRIIILNQGRIRMDGSIGAVQTAADGKVYRIPASARESLEPPFLPVRSEMIGGEEYLRVISAGEQPGTKVTPTLEDGYFCCIHKLT